MNSQLEYYQTNRDRVCRICYENIERNEKAVVLGNVKIGNKKYDLHFHENCLQCQMNLLQKGDSNDKDHN